MKDFRSEIPVCAFINAIVIDRAVMTDFFSDCIRDVMTEAGFKSDRYVFKNPAFIAGLLYCLVVVPKEIWLASKDDLVYKQLEEKRLRHLFKVTIGSKEQSSNPTFEFIRHLRNSVAHANFLIDHSQAFTFWDSPKGETRVWEASVSNPNLMKFLTELAHVVVFLRDDPKR